MTTNKANKDGDLGGLDSSGDAQKPVATMPLTRWARAYLSQYENQRLSGMSMSSAEHSLRNLAIAIISRDEAQ